MRLEGEGRRNTPLRMNTKRKHSFIHSWSTHYVPGTVLGAEGWQRTRQARALLSRHSGRRGDGKQGSTCTNRIISDSGETHKDTKTR